MIRFKCPQCGGSLEAPESRSGEETNCLSCGYLVRIPSPQDDYFRFLCPSCGKSLRAKPQHSGKQTRCTKCHTPLVVPSPKSHAASKPGPGHVPTVELVPAVHSSTSSPVVLISPGSPLTQPGDREFLREVVQLFLFALAVSAIGGAFADFFAPKAPVNLIFGIGTAAGALLCLLLFPIFRRQGLGLAAFCLLCVALGFGGWWGLAEITDSRARGALASRLSTIASWQERVFHIPGGGGSEEGKEANGNAEGASINANDLESIAHRADELINESKQAIARAEDENRGNEVALQEARDNARSTWQKTIYKEFGLLRGKNIQWRCTIKEKKREDARRNQLWVFLNPLGSSLFLGFVPAQESFLLSQRGFSCNWALTGSDKTPVGEQDCRFPRRLLNKTQLI